MQNWQRARSETPHERQGCPDLLFSLRIDFSTAYNIPEDPDLVRTIIKLGRLRDSQLRSQGTPLQGLVEFIAYFAFESLRIWVIPTNSCRNNDHSRSLRLGMTFSGRKILSFKNEKEYHDRYTEGRICFSDDITLFCDLTRSPSVGKDIDQFIVVDVVSTMLSISILKIAVTNPIGGSISAVASSRTEGIIMSVLPVKRKVY